MAAIKQIKIGNTNYDIKALNASNNNQASAVVRDISYGTGAPSGGSAGQVYLKYDDSNTANPYVYAEDTIGTTSATQDLYVTKNELLAGVTSGEFKTSMSIPANTAYLPNNILLKWGKVVGTGSGEQRINFDSPFPNACVGIFTSAGAGSVLRSYAAYYSSSDKNGFYATIVATNKDETYYSSGTINYIAIGY